MSRTTFVILVIVLVAGGAFYGFTQRDSVPAQNQQEPRNTGVVYSLSGTVVSFTGEKLVVHHDFANKFPGVSDIQTIITTNTMPTTVVDKNGDAIVRTPVSISQIKVGDSVVIYARTQLPSPLEVTAKKIDILRF